jgi:hypothetical protein
MDVEQVRETPSQRAALASEANRLVSMFAGMGMMTEAASAAA